MIARDYPTKNVGWIKPSGSTVLQLVVDPLRLIHPTTAQTQIRYSRDGGTRSCIVLPACL
jgi:hypothetical protein